MDLNHLAIFIKVVDTGSLSKAARELGEQKSKVSRAIKSLEADLSMTLIYRNTRQLSLTEAGRKLYQRAQKQIYDLNKMQRLMGEKNVESNGTLRLTTTVDIGSYLMPGIVMEMSKKNPQFQIDLILTDQRVDLVKEGVDLALRIGKMADSELKSLLVGYVSLIIVASPEYLKKMSPLKNINHLASHSVLWFSLGDEAERWRLFEAKSRKEKDVEIHVKHKSNSPKVLLELALAGEGVALLPEFMCIDLLASGELVRVLKDYETQPRPVHFVWPSQVEAHPKLKEFIKLGSAKLQRYFPK
jgi:DNA-binding transcriptional LysR family regulator